MLIGELAGLTGVTTRALRFYEEQGLLTPERTGAGYRTYGPESPRRVGNIRDLLASGFTVEDVRSFLPYLDGEIPRVLGYHPRCDGGYEVGARRIATLNERIATLTRLRDQLVARMPWLAAPEADAAACQEGEPAATVAPETT
ncbi:MerR family transcriptional regulator [Nonomuraea jiangxiensis]|uniref:DNA-binding transcriptional regulator, MerR family n=1 Tax=Nonomuraea jiangxiensis TaxID=633440 RepID=A0A1G8I2G7_9ACTN|nr:MerR family transcriptional regulator [Nonomuraea jiangxiensis]SDI13139.1 DNA-binding transcriptional regulator, MerR family [Nonomuraea jiangxiensis]